MIYCIEDDASIREIEVYTLNSTGFQAEGFADGKAFFEALAKQMPDLILLDIMLPDEDGITILKKLRAASAYAKLPVILATAKGAEYDRIQGLDLGADDYLVKPFSMLEMVSRVRAVLRRSKQEADAAVLSAGHVRMNVQEHTVTVDGKSVVLTLKEFELLKIMLENPRIVFTRDRLLNDIWDMSYSGDTRTVDVHIKTLRQKLGIGGEIIGTVRGVGYRIEEAKP